VGWLRAVLVRLDGVHQEQGLGQRLVVAEQRHDGGGDDVEPSGLCTGVFDGVAYRGLVQRPQCSCLDWGILQGVVREGRKCFIGHPGFR
jgi:hypothetical protein